MRNTHQEPITFYVDGDSDHHHRLLTRKAHHMLSVTSGQNNVKRESLKQNYLLDEILQLDEVVNKNSLPPLGSTKRVWLACLFACICYQSRHCPQGLSLPVFSVQRDWLVCQCTSPICSLQPQTWKSRLLPTSDIKTYQHFFFLSLMSLKCYSSATSLFPMV